MLSLLLALTAPAEATTGLVWQWPTEGHRYHLVATVTTPTLMKAERNIELRASDFEIQLVTTCTPTEAGKKSWEVACVLDDVSIRALPAVAIEPEKVTEILQEYDDRLTGATVQLVFGADGRVRNLDLEGLSKGNERLSEIQELARLMLARAFAPLDLELPKKGDDNGLGAWTAANLTANQYMSAMGTLGQVRVENRITGQEGDIVAIRSDGAGVLSSGDTVVVGAEEKPMFTWDVAYGGTARFDVGRGVLVERKYTVDGKPSASSMTGSTSGTSGDYVQRASAVLLGPGEKPELPASGPL